MAQQNRDAIDVVIRHGHAERSHARTGIEYQQVAVLAPNLDA
jgi:hypothetical protein